MVSRDLCSREVMSVNVFEKKGSDRAETIHVEKDTNSFRWK